MSEHFPVVAPDDSAAALIAAAEHLLSLGFHIEPTGAGKAPAMPKGYTDDFTVEEIDAKALNAFREGRARGLSVVLGKRAAQPTPSGVRIPLAFELEGRAATDAAWMARWKDAADAINATPVIAKLDAGWVYTTPSGAPRWHFNLELAYPEALDGELTTIPARRAKMLDGTMAAELLSSRSLVPPSGGPVHPNGGEWAARDGSTPDLTPTLTLQEFHQLGALLAEIDELPADAVGANGSKTGAWWRCLSEKTRRAGRAYEAQHASVESSRMVLADCGWEEVGVSPDGEIRFTRPGSASHSPHLSLGGPKRPPGSIYVFTDSDDRFESGFFTAFQVLTLTRFAGDPDAAAEFLIETGKVDVSAEVLAVTKRVELFLANTDTPVVARKILDAIGRAENPLVPGIPLAFSRVAANGTVLYSATLTSADTRRLWDSKNIDELTLAVAQPVHATQKGIAKDHTLPASIAGIVATSLEAGRGGLKRVRYEGREPILTAEGAIISEPGFHPEHQALLMMPPRESAFWRTYQVPPRPSQAQAQAAFDLVVELLSDIPFADAAQNARAVLYLLTCVGRALIDVCPGWVFDAPNRGTGKTLLAVIGRILGQGTSSSVSISSRRRDDSETVKAVVAALLAGKRHMHTDELPKGEPIDSIKVSEWITSVDGSSEERILGANNVAKVAGLIFSVCGNNVNVGADHNRRFIPIRMVHREPGPAYARTGFKIKNIIQHVREHRPEFLAALHTILLYGIQRTAAGFEWPAEVTRPGSFTTWNDVILGSLLHVTMPNTANPETPLSAGYVAMRDWIAQTEEQDAGAEEWEPFLAWMHASLGGRAMTAKELFELHRDGGKDRPALPLDLIPAGEAAAIATQWGLALKQQFETTYGEYRLEQRAQAETSKRSKRWLVIRRDRVTNQLVAATAVGVTPVTVVPVSPVPDAVAPASINPLVGAVISPAFPQSTPARIVRPALAASETPTISAGKTTTAEELEL